MCRTPAQHRNDRVDQLLFPELADSDVIVTNSRGVFERPIAEFVLATVLAYAKDMPRTWELQQQRRRQHRETDRGQAAGIHLRERCRMTDLAMLDTVDLARHVRVGDVSPVEATEAALQRIDDADGQVNAFYLVDSDRAIADARESENRWRRGEPAGLLDGVPTSIKDLILTAGWPTLRGSRLITPDQAWVEDAPVTARLREHGAVIIGKTTSPEFGWKGVTDSPRCGITSNPWDPTRTAGGSSGGSAAAVALGMRALSVGTDGGGSIRIPAAFSGVFGLKPTYGRVPLHPASPFGTLAQAGPIIRTVADAALMMDIISQPDVRDWSALPPPAESFRDALSSGVGGLRVAFGPDLGYVDVDTEVATIVRRAVDVQPISVRRSTRSTQGSLIRSRPTRCCGSVGRRRSCWASARTPCSRSTLAWPRGHVGTHLVGIGLHRRDRRAGGARPADGLVPSDL